jgi:hypothetical protein
MRVLRFDAGAHRGVIGPFVLLGFSDPGEDDVLWIEGWPEVVVREDLRSTAMYDAIFRELEAIAALESKFSEIIEAIKRRV